MGPLNVSQSHIEETEMTSGLVAESVSQLGDKNQMLQPYPFSSCCRMSGGEEGSGGECPVGVGE